MGSLFGDPKNIYPKIPIYKNSHGIKHILLTLKSLKRVVNCLNNHNGFGEKFRNYYLNVLNLCNIYDKYQSEFTTRLTSSMIVSTQNMSIIVSKNTYIDKALEHDNMLTVIDFITTTNYPIDKLYIDKFWATLKNNMLIYVNDELIQ